VIRHSYHEEVYLLEGYLTDLTLGQTFGPGCYTSRRPRMPHGPYRTDAGCVLLEIRTLGGLRPLRDGSPASRPVKRIRPHNRTSM
jgi:hypothetical protein